MSSFGSSGRHFTETRFQLLSVPFTLILTVILLGLISPATRSRVKFEPLMGLPLCELTNRFDPPTNGAPEDRKDAGSRYAENDSIAAIARRG